MKKKRFFMLLLVLILSTVTTIAMTLIIKNVDSNNDLRRIAVCPPELERIRPANTKEAMKDFVPTADCAVNIADVVFANYIASIEEDESSHIVFTHSDDIKSYDAIVEYYEKTNEWRIRYRKIKLDDLEIKEIEDGTDSGERMCNSFLPDIFINKTTGEISMPNMVFIPW